MNIWAIVAVIAALIFGVCVGYIIAYIREKRHVDDLLRCCEETSTKLAAISKEYEDFMKAAHEVDRWPKNNSHITMKDNLADYLKAKYFDNEELDPDCDDENEVDEDDMDIYV